MLFFTLLITSLAALDIPDFVFNRPFGKVESTTPFPVNVGNLREATRAVRLTGGDIRLFDAEDAEDGIKWGVTIGNKDELENGGINWGEITKIAGQINEIGHILGYDADDADNSVTVATACAIIGAACALANTGLKVYDTVKGSDAAEALDFDAEDAENGVKWSVTVGNEDDVENGGINWGEITKIAGQVNEIGHILGFDAEDDEALSNDAVGRWCSMWNSWMKKNHELQRQRQKQQTIEEEKWREEARQSVRARWAKKVKAADFAVDDEDLSNTWYGYEEYKEKQRRLEAEKKLAHKRAIMEEAAKEEEQLMRKLYKEGKLSFD